MRLPNTTARSTTTYRGEYGKAGAKTAYEAAGLLPPVAAAQMVGEAGLLAGEITTETLELDEAGGSVAAIYVRLEDGSVLDNTGAAKHISTVRKLAFERRSGCTLPESDLGRMMQRFLDKDPKNFDWLLNYQGKYGAWHLDHLKNK